MSNKTFDSSSFICDKNYIALKNNNFHKVKTTFKYSSSTIALLTLAACGGGGGAAAPTTPTTPVPTPTPTPIPTTSVFVQVGTNTFLANSNLPGTFNQSSSSADLTVTGRGGND